LKHVGILSALGLAVISGIACSGEDKQPTNTDGGEAGAGAAAGSGGRGGSGGATSGAAGAGTAGASAQAGQGTADAGAAGDSGGAGGDDAAGAAGEMSGHGGEGGAPDSLLPLPDGSRERGEVVNLVDAAAAAELEGFLSSLEPSAPEFVETPLLGLNLFLEHYVEEYDFVYLVTDHPVESTVAGRFQAVNKQATPGTGADFDTELPGVRSNGKTRGVIGIQYRNDWYGPLGHEMTHYWANRFGNAYGFGLGLDENHASHWGYIGEKGVLGGFDASTLLCAAPASAVPPNCTAESNGRFRYVVEHFYPHDNGVMTPHSPLELYVMGLLPFAELPPSLLVLDQASALRETYDEATNTLLVEAAGIGTLATADIVTDYGSVPALPEAERALRAVFVVLSAAPASDELLDDVARWAAVHGNRVNASNILSWEELTGGLMTLDTTLGPRRALDEPAPPPRVQSSCDLWEQDCGAGRACFFGTASHYCGLSRGGTRGEPCASGADCAPGFACVGSQTVVAAACQPYCSADDDDPDACSSLCPWYVLEDEDDEAVAGICQTP
jgi:hypothetical protein